MPGPGGLRGHLSMVRSVGRGLDPSAGGCPGDGRWREAARGVGDAAPYTLPGSGRLREAAPHPALQGHLPPRGKAVVVGEGFIPPGVFAATRISSGRRGRRPLRVTRERAAAGRRPLRVTRERAAAGRRPLRVAREWAVPCLTPPTSPPAYSRCCRRQNRRGRSTHRPHTHFRRWIRSRGASGHRRSGPDGTGVCRRRNFSAAG